MRAPRFYLSVGIAVLVFAGGWLILLNERSASQGTAPAFGTTTSTLIFSPQQNAALSVEVQNARRTPPEGQKEYDNEQYRFSLFYPSDLAVNSYDEGGGASTITFQDVQTAQGFQIYIVPYSGTQVSAAQFNRDEPSGVRQQAQNVTIDDAVGTSFYSTNIELGETAEIWFVHTGYLYEVTTLKPLASWLSQMLETWKFL